MKKIKIEGQDIPARLAQEFHVFHTPNEFLISLIEIIPQMEYAMREGANKQPHITQLQNTGLVHQVVGRFAISPASVKKLAQVLQRNIQQYESKFGEIAINPPEGLQ